MKRTIIVAMVACLATALASGACLADESPKYGDKGHIQIGPVKISFLQLSLSDVSRLRGKRMTVFGYTSKNTFTQASFRGLGSDTGDYTNLYFKFQDYVSEGELRRDGTMKWTHPNLNIIMSGKALLSHHSVDENKGIQAGRQAWRALQSANGGKALLRIEGTLHEFTNPTRQLYLSARSIKVIDKR